MRDTGYGHDTSSLFQGSRDILLKAKQNLPVIRNRIYSSWYHIFEATYITW